MGRRDWGTKGLVVSQSLRLLILPDFTIFDRNFLYYKYY